MPRTPGLNFFYYTLIYNDFYMYMRKNKDEKFIVWFKFIMHRKLRSYFIFFEYFILEQTTSSKG